MSQIRLPARHAALALVLSSVTLMSQAALVTRTGTSTAAEGTRPGPGDPTVVGTAAWAKAEFLGLVDPNSLRTEGFGSFKAADASALGLGGETFQGDSRPPLSFVPTPSGTGTPATGFLIPSAPLQGDPQTLPPQNPGLIADENSLNGFSGRFNTTGGFSTLTGTSGTWATGKWWEATGDFDIAFASGVNAFGFYLTDSSDFKGMVDLWLTPEIGDEIKISNITGATFSAAPNGSLQFFGFVDDQRKFTRVRFDITQTSSDPLDFDVFGLDDALIAATRTGGSNPAPEPASLPHAVLALGALAATRRRKAT
jgi:hypothetical protein